MKKIIIPALILLIGVALVIWKPWASNQETNDPSKLIYGFEVNTVSLDPAQISDAYISRVIDQVFEGLVSLDENNEVQPCLATSWSGSADGSIWKFNLRDDVFFHDSDIFPSKQGRKLTARDVKYSYTRLLKPGSASSYAIAGVIAGADALADKPDAEVSGIKVLDELTVEFTLLKPDPLFPRRLTSVILGILPKEVAQLPETNRFGQDTTVGTGPYSVEQRTDNLVVLRAFPKHWSSVPLKYQTIEVRVVKNDALRLAAALKGEIDFTFVPSLLARTIAESDGSSFKMKKADSLSNLQIAETFNSTFLGLNCERLDQEFRVALSSAVDRTQLTSLFMNGVASPSIGPVPLALEGYTEPSGATSPDLAAARESISQSQSKKTIEILVHEKEASEQIGQLLVSQFEKIGVSVTLKKLEYGAVIQRMAQGDYDACVMSFEYVYSSPEPILEGLLNSKRIPAPNFWRLNDPKVDRLLSEFQTTRTVNEANQLSQKIVTHIQSNPPAVYLFQNKSPTLSTLGNDKVPVNGHSIPMFWKFSKD